MTDVGGKKSTKSKSYFLGYGLNSNQDVYVNYLLPTIIGCFLYILHFACDFVTAYRHFKEENPVWGGLTIFFMYLPAVGCFIVTISSWELWPDYEGCGGSNIKWGFCKIVQHVFFPAWSMWRFAEKLFWTIEAKRAEDEDARDEALKVVTAPRTIELYYFLQGYIQAGPQILLQLHVLMRQVTYVEEQTVNAQALSIIMSLAKMAITTTFYQRFKSQKIAGKCYPWFKPYKYEYDPSISPSAIRRVGISYSNPPEILQSDPDAIEVVATSSKTLERRRSSDFYEQPSNSFIESQTEKGTPFMTRETSVVGGPRRIFLQDPNITEPDYFNPQRLLVVKGLPEDDFAGKTVSFLWWFCFLLARMLAISSFGYFYPMEVIWILAGHFIVVVALLLYDVRADEVRRAKAIFFIFIGFVYLFCLIEFKIKFKKVKFIYNGFFLLMFTENFVMCFVWWFRDMEDIYNDWWYRYIFYVIIWCSAASMVSMLFYVKLLKPNKVVVDVVPHA